MVVLLNAIALNVYRTGNAEHPWGVLACLVVMTAWTGAATYLYARPQRRGPLLLGTDLLVALAMLVASPLVKGPEFNATVPGFWVMAALLAWAAHYRWIGGLAAGLVLATVDLLLRDGWNQSNYGNAFLLVIGGPVVGYLAALLEQMAEQRDRAERAAAGAAERARLARAVHDGVLQVLAMVQRRGSELGGDGAELARLAGEQEAQLRALIRAEGTLNGPVAPAADTGGTQGASTGASLAASRGPRRARAAPQHQPATADLADRLARLGARRGVEVATPGSAVSLPAGAVEELEAVVVACLDNVRIHVGQDASAWVLLEDLGDRVELSVRDEGPGIAPGRLEQAVDEGRLGVSESICGRVRDLGGTALLETGGDGTEWIIVVPRPGADSTEVVGR